MAVGDHNKMNMPRPVAPAAQAVAARPPLQPTHINLDDPRLEPVLTDEEKKMPVAHEGPTVDKYWLSVLLISDHRYCPHSDVVPANPNCGCEDNTIGLHDIMTTSGGMMPRYWQTRWWDAIPHMIQTMSEDSDACLMTVEDYAIARITVGTALQVTLQPVYPAAANAAYNHDVEVRFKLHIPEAKENGPNGDKTWTLAHPLRVNAAVEDIVHVDFGTALGTVNFDGVAWRAISLGQYPVSGATNSGIMHASICADHALGRHNPQGNPHLTCPECVTGPIARRNNRMRNDVRERCADRLEQLERKVDVNLTEDEKKRKAQAIQILRQRSTGVAGDLELRAILRESNKPIQWLLAPDHPLCQRAPVLTVNQ